MTIQAMKQLPFLALAAALLVLPHAVRAAEPPTITLALYSNLDADTYVDLWLGGVENGTGRMALVRERHLAAGGSLHQSGLPCEAAGDCGQAFLEVRDRRGNVVCKGWMEPRGGEVTLNMGVLRSGSGTGYAICSMGGRGVRQVEIPGAPYMK